MWDPADVDLVPRETPAPNMRKGLSRPINRESFNGDRTDRRQNGRAGWAHCLQAWPEPADTMASSPTWVWDWGGARGGFKKHSCTVFTFTEKGNLGEQPTRELAHRAESEHPPEQGQNLPLSWSWGCLQRAEGSLGRVAQLVPSPLAGSVSTLCTVLCFTSPEPSLCLELRAGGTPHHQAGLGGHSRPRRASRARAARHRPVELQAEGPEPASWYTWLFSQTSRNRRANDGPDAGWGGAGRGERTRCKATRSGVWGVHMAGQGQQGTSAKTVL
jgi:hypothetical protein